MKDLEEILYELEKTIEPLEFILDPNSDCYVVHLSIRLIFSNILKALNLSTRSEKERFKGMLKEIAIEEINKVMVEQNISINELAKGKICLKT